MENIKFYNVKIGTNTRAGNLNVLQSFVAQSDKNQNSVYTYYSNKYKGFGISVEEVKEIIKDEIPEISNTYDFSNKSPEQIEIEKLKNIIKQKENAATFNYFTGEIRYDVTTEISQKFRELSSISKEHTKKKEEIENEFKAYIHEKYGVKLLEYITIEEFNSGTISIPFRCKLSGNITPSNNEL